ncbi:acetyl-CoA acyltransferase/acetyl-CoA acyltransferase [Fodinibius salinus]|uniref:acetyl-CoA C-acyltransferase n=1 Tax=Fodinibius salinus TaxID=860790 RepID=A0A5D3YHI1_9BACT|nr:acetyl-CoA C-acyltransferase [Fodinibius salinus]TYP93364.1 acetyl-CoA acyltransferase/acetyl-CoA acyltransferase [Fodinibius salinus]
MANQLNNNSPFEAVIVDGGRIPFQRSGTGYKKMMSYDLGRMAIEGLISRSGIHAGELDRVIMGTVIQEVNTSNVARESALGAGIPNTVPAHTVTQACISSNQAITSAVNLIRSGQAQIILAGGTETMSDIPIRFRKKFRQKLLDARKYKSLSDFLGFFKGLRPSHLLPEIPSISEFSTGDTMGESCDRMAAHFGIGRKEQDQYALRSHQMAAKATNEGLLDDELLPAATPPDFDAIEYDNTYREDTSMEKLEKLSPAFIKPHGTITAGNSSAFTDGASASLIMEKQTALNHNITPKAILRNYTYVAQDPEDELLLGPAYATPKVLDAAELQLADIDVFEFHEAFAGQILTVLKALNSDKFAKEKLDRDQKVGEIPMDKFNCWGGSLSLGHPFGATGTRLVTTAANRLHHEDGRFALVAACAAGGQGHAMILERFDG